MKARIKKCDARNFCIEVYREVVNPKTKESRFEWIEDGYFGHKLDHALEFAVLRAFEVDELVTIESHRQAMGSLLQETRKLFTGEVEA